MYNGICTNVIDSRERDSKIIVSIAEELVIIKVVTSLTHTIMSYTIWWRCVLLRAWTESCLQQGMLKTLLSSQYQV